MRFVCLERKVAGMIDEKILLERLEESSYWTPSTFDEDGYSNDDSEEVIDLYRAIEIANQLAEESKNKYVRTDEVGYMLDTIEMCGDETWMDYYHKALKGLCELSGKESNNGWIPCSERLPEAENDYIVCFVSGYIAISTFFEGMFWDAGDVIEPVAWQPLPEPYHPKEDKQK